MKLCECRKMSKQKEWREGSGSITVFLSILFLLIFSLIGVAFENVRVLSSEGYMRTAAHSAAMTVFGSYNRELFEQYGLFAYGGYDGKEKENLAEEFNEILINNIQTAPGQAQISYANLYRIGEIDSMIEAADYLTDQKVFSQQVKAYLKGEAVQDLKDLLATKNLDSTDNNAAKEKLMLTKEYEEGKFDEQKEEAKEDTTEKQDTGEEDLAGGNPLEAFTDLVRDGVLNLVCDASRLSDGVIAAIDDEVIPENTVFPKEDKCAADYLLDLIGNQNRKEDGIVEKETQKLEYIAYADKQFSSYRNDRKRITKYGMEYLAAGKQEERDNLLFVVNRLLGIRTMVNFAGIVSDTVLQQKSLTTATVLAGFTGMPPVIRAVQYVILLILAFEEACIDVTALLDGRSVPALKSTGSLKMTYEEICMASRMLFASKAKSYPQKGGSRSDITYQQYLYLFLLTISKENLQNRSYDLIQYDLRERYNQTFCIKSCICKSRYSISYEIPYLFEKLPFLQIEDLENHGNLRSLEVNYAYKSR